MILIPLFIMQGTDILSAYDAAYLDKRYNGKTRKLNMTYDITREDYDRLKPVLDLIRQEATWINYIRIVCDLRDFSDNPNCCPRSVLFDANEKDIKNLEELGYGVYSLRVKEWYGMQYNLLWGASPELVMKYYRYKASMRTPEETSKLSKCVICNTKPADFSCSGCDHRCLCDTCSDKMSKNREYFCPICKQYFGTVTVDLDELDKIGQ